MVEPVLFPAEKTASFASSLKRDRLRALAETPDIPGTILIVICIDHFGTEFFGWEPDTLKMELHAEIGAKLPQQNLDKIWALVTHLTTNQFFTSLEVFIPTCNVLSDHEANFTHFDPADVEEMAWALTEVNLIDPIEDPDQFSDDIKLYVGERLRSEGFVRPPKMLRWAKFKDGDEGEGRVDMFQDDPVFFNAIWDRQQKDHDGINAYVHSRMNRIVTILKDIPLITGSVEKIFKKK